jgi:transcriptional regulator with XRE-family HTH domain
MQASIKEIFAKNLKTFRENKSFTQGELGQLIGLDASNISRMESGKQFPDPEKIDLIAKTLGVNSVTLFEMKKTDPKNTMSAQDMESLYKDLVEANTEYRLVPKTVLDGEYRLMLNSEIEENRKDRRETIEANKETIGLLKARVLELERQLALKPKKADK